ncbi:PEGA domain-containing protein [Myxococcota bacterium]|nr:PEGA domain-containing protein [Myxococcota bacterium]MBU1380380.1 PEGA domain-containing protein [Myxococcota bacterium]MBU1496523.1 PEGA domain-containing protein [Myxococcota bacterium]
MRSIINTIFIIFLLTTSATQAKNLSAAKDHYEKAEKHYSVGEFDKALENYKKSFDMSDKPELLFNIAQCHRQLKQYEKAIFFYKLFLSRLPSSGLKSEVEKHISDMQKAMTPGGKTARISIITDPPGADIFIDRFSGKPDGQSPSVIAVQPGPHLVVISKDGFVQVHKKLKVVDQKIEVIEIKLVPQTKSGPKPNPVKEKPSAFKNWKFITGASLTGLFTLGSIYTGMKALDYESKFNDSTDPDDRDSFKKKGERMALYTDIMIGAAVVSAALTVLSFIMTGSGEEKSESRVSILPVCTGSGCSVSASFTIGGF